MSVAVFIVALLLGAPGGLGVKGAPPPAAHRTFYNHHSHWFDNSDDYTSVADNAAWQCSTKMTLSLWVQVRSCPGTGQVVTKWVPDDGFGWPLLEWFLYFGAATPGHWWRFSASDGFSLVNCDADGTLTCPTPWYHVAVVFDGTLIGAARVAMYVNSVLQVSSCSPGSPHDHIIDTWTPMGFAGNPDGSGGSAPISVDEFGLWCDAATSADVNKLYNAGRPSDISKLTLSIGSWKMWYRVEGPTGSANPYPTLVNYAPGMSSYPMTSGGGSQADYQRVVP